MSILQAVTATDFEREVIEASRTQPVLVDFWAAWCGPCRMLGPVLEQLAGELAGRLKVVKIDTDAEPALASQFRIRGIPAVKLFRDGQEVAEFVGAQPLAAVRRFVAPHLGAGSGEPSPVELARAASARGDHAAAIAQLQPLHERDPEDVDTTLALARALTLAARGEESEALLRGLPPVLQSDERVQAIRALRHFANLAASPDETDAIQSARVRAARALLSDDFARGIDELLGAMQRNRRYATGQGRDDAVNAFALAPGDDARVAQARRRLATLLH